MSRTHPFLYITGGCRSGKSDFAQKAAESCSPSRLFLATARAEDEEMRERVLRHQQTRGEGWRLYELAEDEAPHLWEILPSIITPGEALLFDCLTLWAASMMIDEGIPSGYEAACATLAKALDALPCPVIMVNNEVGMGVVPSSVCGRAFRDMAGMAGQAVARVATDAILVASGIALALKGSLPPGIK